MANRKLTYNVDNHIILAVDAPVLSRSDSGRLLLLDATWKLLPQLHNCLTGTAIKRSLPKEIITAYPRKSKDGSDPIGGLASVEALYVARALLGDIDHSLLNEYYWKDAFLASLPSDLR